MTSIHNCNKKPATHTHPEFFNAKPCVSSRVYLPASNLFPFFLLAALLPPILFAWEPPTHLSRPLSPRPSKPDTQHPEQAVPWTPTPTAPPALPCGNPSSKLQMPLRRSTKKPPRQNAMQKTPAPPHPIVPSCNGQPQNQHLANPSPPPM